MTRYITYNITQGLYVAISSNLTLELFDQPFLLEKRIELLMAIKKTGSINKAAKENNYSTAELYNRIKEGALTKNNYYSLELMDEYIQKPRLELKNRIIYVYNEDGSFDKECNFNEIHEYLKIPSNRRLSTIIKTEGLINHKQLRLEKFNSIKPYIKKNKSKIVLVYKLDGSFIGEYDSINKVCKELNLDNSTVNKVLRGVNKSTKGYILKIKDIV